MARTHMHMHAEWGEEGKERSWILGRWVTQQRVLNKLSRLEPDRVNRLNALGFVWDAQEAEWMAQWQAVGYHRLTVCMYVCMYVCI